MCQQTIKKLFVCFILILGLSFAVFAQGTTSRITGIVQDSNSAAVSSATVVLTNEATNTTLTTQTNESGNFVFDLIQVGSYRVTVEKQGFKKFVANNNIVNINQPTNISVKLEAGGVTETVTVNGAAEAVQTGSSGNIGSTIEQRTLESLPIIGTRGRNPLDLLNYQPGVVNGANTGGGVHVNGSRDRAFNFTLDGIDINESSAGGSNFTPLRPNPDSIQEFQVVTSNFTAELGRSSGAQVTFVTKSGKNYFFGNGFEYYQTPDVNANEYQNNLNGRAKNQFVQHIFGGSLGGPIIKNKLFFFTNVQLLRAYDTALVTRTVYTQTARQGIFRYVVGGANAPTGTATPSVNASGAPLFPNCSATITTLCIATYNINANQASGTGNPTPTGVDPALLSIINAMPGANNFSAGDGLNTAGFDFASPQHEKQYDFVTKFDYNISSNSSVYVRYAQGQQNSFGDSGNGGRPIFPGSPNLVDTFRDPKNLAINYRWSPRSNLTNEFLFGLSKFAFSFNTPSPDVNLPYSFNLVATPNTNFSYNARRLRTYQFVDNVTWIKGNHIVKTGINFRFGRQIDDRSSVAGTNVEPIVSFSTAGNNYTSGIQGNFVLPSAGINSNDGARLRSMLNDFLGRVSSVTQAFVSDPSNPNQFAPANTRWNFTAFYPEYDFYLQDTWRVRPNLVFDIGLRYEVKLSPGSDGRTILKPDRQLNYGTPSANNIRFVEGKLFKNDFNNFGPSVGFAYDPFGNGKTSIRANYRLSYDRFPSQLFAANIFQNAPGNTVQGAGSYSGERLLRQGLPTLTPTSTPSVLRQSAAFGPSSSITVLDSDTRYPEIQSWSLSFQREIGSGFVVEADYIGKRGTHLFGGYDVNQVNIGASGFGETFLQAFNTVRAGNNSPLINALFTGNSANNAGTTTFRSLNTTAISQGGVAAAALSVSQRACQTADVTNGICTATGGQLLASTIGNPFFFQKFPQFTSALNVLDSNDISFYNSLQLVVKRRINNGLGFQVSYTLSKSNDTRSFDPTFSVVSRANAQSASSTPFDINNRRLNYAPSDFDRRHELQGTFVYELPFGRGKMFGGGIPKALDYAIGGWQLAGALNLGSGRPFTVYSGVNSFSNVNQSTADCNGCKRKIGKVVQESGTNFFFDAATRALFTTPAPGSTGNTGRNFFIAPRYFQLDMSLSKRFKFTERLSFELRVDARNITNTPSFDLPTATFTSTIFGRIRDGVVSNARRIQLSGNIRF